MPHPLHLTSSPGLGVEEFPLEGVVLDGSDDVRTATFVENPGSEGAHPADKKRTNGRSTELVLWEGGVDKGLDARDSLGSRASVSETDAERATTDAAAAAPELEAINYADLDIPGADESDDVPPFMIESTPEQVAEAEAFFEAAKAQETKEQQARARSRSRVMTIMQYRAHPKSGVVMMTQEQIDFALEKLRHCIHRVAYVWHLLDRVVEVDEGTEQAVCCGLKGPHVHIVIWFTEDRPTVRTVSDAFLVPSARVKLPREVAAQEGTALHKGRNAAEKAFYDFAEYLTHESRLAGAIQGVHQPERYYLVDNEQPGNPGKYQYGRGRVVANFDFSRDLDAHMAGRVRAADGGQTLRARKLKLRRAVMEGMALIEAREKDRDAYADDLPRLRALAREYDELAGKAVAEQIGPVWRKSLVLAAGPTRQGKDVLLEEVGSQLTWLAGLAGAQWQVVKPAGRNTLEGIGRAEIVHHEDVRHYLVPAYDEGLRYFDPNQAVEAGTRHTNTAAPTPRAILASTSETMLSLGVTLKRRASSDHLAELASDRKTAPRVAVDIDEFLFRIGWLVEVAKPEDAGDDLELIRRGMMVSIFRVRESAGEPRIERAYTRGGDWIGDVRTRHELEPVAMIRGCVEAARFLAISIVQERNADVVAAIPADEFEALVAGRLQIEADAKAHQEQAAQEREAAAQKAAEAAERRAARQRERDLEIEQALARQRALCTCSEQILPNFYLHADDCPFLPEDVREARKLKAAEELENRVERIRRNGLLLDAPKTAR